MNFLSLNEIDLLKKPSIVLIHTTFIELLIHSLSCSPLFALILIIIRMTLSAELLFTPFKLPWHAGWIIAKDLSISGTYFFRDMIIFVFRKRDLHVGWLLCWGFLCHMGSHARLRSLSCHSTSNTFKVLISMT